MRVFETLNLYTPRKNCSTHNQTGIRCDAPCPVMFGFWSVPLFGCGVSGGGWGTTRIRGEGNYRECKYAGCDRDSLGLNTS